MSLLAGEVGVDSGIGGGSFLAGVKRIVSPNDEVAAQMAVGAPSWPYHHCSELEAGRQSRKFWQARHRATAQWIVHWLCLHIPNFGARVTRAASVCAYCHFRLLLC